MKKMLLCLACALWFSLSFSQASQPLNGGFQYMNITPQIADGTLPLCDPDHPCPPKPPIHQIADGNLPLCDPDHPCLPKPTVRFLADGPLPLCDPDHPCPPRNG